ncbi:hypothetical protein Q4566_16495 [Tamlana sp. 2_MG-2023]|uniref:hypothetical protein n=1 Tax=unclassified Tamlana TaxID=2614803 RepID=UPI0026E15EE1|nr:MULTISPECIES: hypothetical protein [unclassified Tamlana]MDO6761809.1 hypothetical protein [Tamlana sp. 2_MG-2023]MDO6792552.1 hypothetical protein [Tamlana sp. 1_MG-2023]
MKLFLTPITVTKLFIAIYFCFSNSISSQNTENLNPEFAKNWIYVGEFLNDNEITKNKSLSAELQLKPDGVLVYPPYKGTWTANTTSKELHFKIKVPDSDDMFPMAFKIIYFKDDILVLNKGTDFSMNTIYTPKGKTVSEDQIKKTVTEISTMNKAKQDAAYLGYTPEGDVINSFKFNTALEKETNGFGKASNDGIVYVLKKTDGLKIVVIPSNNAAPIEWTVLEKTTNNNQITYKSVLPTEYDFDLHENVTVNKKADIKFLEDTVSIVIPSEEKTITYSNE